jgi:hypothetical protein
MTSKTSRAAGQAMPAAVTGVSAEAQRRACSERWNALPGVIRATFDCARKVSVSQSLKALGVEATPSRAIERAYETASGTLVMTVWHDQIQRGADGTLTYAINAADWQAEARGLQVGRATLMRELLVKHAGQEAHVLLLKRGWDANDTQRAERNAPDIRMWTLQAAGDGRYVLRRPMLRKAA